MGKYGIDFYLNKTCAPLLYKVHCTLYKMRRILQKVNFFLLLP